MPAQKGRGLYLRFGSEKETSLGRANGKLRRVSCFLNASLTEEGLELRELEVTCPGFCSRKRQSWDSHPGLWVQAGALHTAVLPEACRLGLAGPSSWSDVRKAYVGCFVSELGACDFWDLVLSGSVSQKGMEAGGRGGGSGGWEEQRSARELPDSSPGEICPWMLFPHRSLAKNLQIYSFYYQLKYLP